MTWSPWSDEELEYLQEHDKLSSTQLTLLFKNKGWDRSKSAIEARKFKLKCHRDTPNNPFKRILERQKKLKAEAKVI